ncbi:MAG TPA: hypothetical protein VNO79_00155 [Actinomycetota bacterium]|nr:hypothetical protein [Actinomycetota bacterium]
MGAGSRPARALRGHHRVALDAAPLVNFLGGHAPRDAVADELLARAAAGELEVVASVVTEAELLVLSYVHLDDRVRGS